MTVQALRPIAEHNPDPPRYLGYPTVAQFRPDVGPAQFDRWLAALPSGATAALHLHVPFCPRLCAFCCCRTQAVRTTEPLTGYVEALKAETDHVARRLPEGVRIVAVHWLGGSPTMLAPALMRTLDRHLRAALPIAPDAEVAVEVEPHDIEPGRLDALFDSGLSLARVGLLDFDPSVQRAAGRAQDPAQVAVAVAALRARGLRTLSVELLYGLPLQTRWSLRATCARLLELAPDRIVLAGYMHAPRIAKRQSAIPVSSLPDAAARDDQFAAAAAVFSRAGYARCGLDAFARPGDALAVAAATGGLRRDLAGYASDATDVVLGLGAAAISRFPLGYVQNVADTGGYLGRIAAGAAAAERGAPLGAEDRLRARAIEMLLCDRRLDLDRLALVFGDAARGLDADVDRALAQFAGLVRRGPEGLALCEARDPLLARRVAQVFDRHAGRFPAAAVI